MSLLRRLTSLLFIIVSVSVGVVLLRQSYASAFGNIFTDAAISVGNATVRLVNVNSRYVQKSSAKVRVWFPSNSGSVTIVGGDWCSGEGADNIETEDGSWSDFNSGDPITKFAADDFPGQTKYGRKQCNGGMANDKMTMSFSGLSPDDRQLGYYYVDITISYVGTGSSSWDGVENYFYLDGSTNALIGSPGGTNGYTATIEQTDTSPANTDYRIPFGRPCEEKGTETAKLAFYDLDNDGGSGAQKGGKITIRLHNDTDNNYVNFTGGVGTTWTPPSSTSTQAIFFTAGEKKKYTLEINNAYYNNTLQYSIPYPQIFSKPCPPDNPPPHHDHATVVPSISVDGEAELGGNATFTQQAKVKDFPDLNAHEWGYNETATRRAISTGTMASRVNYAADRGAFDHYDNATVRCGDNSYQDDCSGHGHNVGTAKNPDWRKYHCDGGAYKDDCGSNYAWQCTDAGITRSGNNGVGSDPNVDDCKLYRYFCRDNNGVWKSGDGNQAYNGYTGQENNPGCNNRWRCPSPSTLKDWSSSNPNINCHIYYCAYDPGQVNTFFEPDGDGTDRPQDDFCQRRCNNGAGAPPQLRSQDDYRCYVRPTFSIHCTWSGDASGVTAWETVTGNGNYCLGNNPVTVPATSLGQICITTTPGTKDVWSSPAPGNAENPVTVWSVQINPANASACATVYQKPYFKVFNGDANAAAQFGATVDPGQTIHGFNQDAAGNYAGSSAQVAAFATAAIDSFVSASAGAPLATPTLLTFASTTSGYGGGFGSILMPEFWTPPGTLPHADQTISSATAPEVYVDGNVYITGAGISLGDGPWTVGSDVPTYKLIVKGNIYISPSVTRLDGTYIALNDGAGGGTIYTCAPAAGTVTQAWINANAASCSTNQLKVNGSLVAQRAVKLLRFNGTLGQQGGETDASTTKAAEAITYSPEVWLRQLNIDGGGSGSSYAPADAFINLPPVL